MHRAGAQRTTVSSRLVDQVFRPLGSDVDVSAEGERERHFNSLLRHHFQVFSEYFVFSTVKGGGIERFRDFEESAVSVLPGMWQQRVPDILWSDEVLQLFCLLY